MGCKYCNIRYKETSSVTNEDILIMIQRGEKNPIISVLNEQEMTAVYWYANYCPNCGDDLTKPYPDGRYWL